MMDIWLLIAMQAIALVGGAITGALALALGGMGGLRSLRTRQDALTNKLELIDGRITHEVKARASKAGVKARTDTELVQEAMTRIGDTPAVGNTNRPSVASLRG